MSKQHAASAGLATAGDVTCHDSRQGPGAVSALQEYRELSLSTWEAPEVLMSRAMWGQNRGFGATENRCR